MSKKDTSKMKSMKRFNGIATIVAYCFIVVLSSACNKRANMYKTSLRTHVADSVLVVDNFYYQDAEGNIDSIKFSLSLPHEIDRYSFNDKKEAEKKRRDRLNNPKCFCVDFIGTIDGYKVSAVFHPDDQDDTVGMAVYHFKSDKNDFTISDGYYWRAWDTAFKGNIDKLKFDGDKGSVPIAPKALQGKAKRIENVDSSPFVMKDVDFDGEKEILIRVGGYNRYYWNVYKVIGKNKAAYMNYNNVVYGEGEDAYTEFDYKNKTMYICEQMGCCEQDESKFIRKKNVVDKLDPLEELYYTSKGFTNGMSFCRYYKKGTMIRYKEEVYPGNQPATIEAIYNLRDNVLRLDSVLLFTKGTKLKAVVTDFTKE